MTFERTVRTGRWWLIGLTLVALILAVMMLVAGQPTAATTLDRLTVDPLTAYHPPFQTFVASGDTIESVCRRLAGDDWVIWRDVLVDEIDPKRLFPGTEFRGTLTPSGALESLGVIFDSRNEVHLEASLQGILVARIERPIVSEVLRLEGEVESSLFGAMDSAGGDPELAVQIAQIYQWDIDFLRDIRK